MVLDVAAAVLIAMLAVLGWRAGALHTLVRMGALALAFFLSRPLGAALRPDVAGWIPNHPALAGHLATFLAAAGLLTVFSILGSILVRFIKGAKVIKGADRLLGLVLGTAKGAVLSYALLCFAVALERPLAQAFPAFGAQLTSSSTAGLARDMNFVDWLLERPAEGDESAPAKDQPKSAASSSSRSATPPAPGPGMTRSARSRMPWVEASTATARPAARRASRSLSWSPTATI